MIVVVGTPAWRHAGPAAPAGRAATIALAAAAAGARVELVGRVGDDDPGDALLIALARAGVGHVAVLRDAARATPIVVVAPDEPPLGAVDAEDAAGLLVDAVEAEAVGAGSVSGPGPVLEAADVALGLRYITEFDVLVLADDVPPDAIPAAVEAAAYATARLVVLVPAGSDTPPGLPADATVLAAPVQDPGDRFASLVGAYAAGLDAGLGPAEAFAAAAGSAGWEEVGG